MPSAQYSPVTGVKPFPSDKDALLAALKGCQQGLGGLFPSGTAAMYVHPDDRAGYASQREQINRLADALESGELTLVHRGASNG